MTSIVRRNRTVATVIAGVMALGLFSLGTPAHAHRASSKENTYRVATYGLGAVTAYGLVKKNTTMTLIGAAGTYLAHKEWKDEVNKRRRAERRDHGPRRRR